MVKFLALCGASWTASTRNGNLRYNTQPTQVRKGKGMKRTVFMTVLAGAILLVAGCARTDDPAPDNGTGAAVGEKDTLRGQIEKCWDVPTGLGNLEELVVVMKIQVNRDRTVKNVVIVDAARMETDIRFRKMAESARQAILNPDCRLLKLPPGKYDLWTDITLSFDPSLTVGR